MIPKHKLKLGDARSLLLLLEGECVPSSRLSQGLTEILVTESLVLPLTHGTRISYRVLNPSDLKLWLLEQYHIENIASWIKCYEQKETLSRSELIKHSGDSKSLSLRSFKGFLVNVCEPIDVEMKGQRFTLSPQPGMAHYVEDFEHFKVAEDVCIVGIENGENFQHLDEQRHLFDKSKILFVSRYPQSHDLRKWLTMNSNSYLHFGDFDLAGIFIYLTEFYAYLGEKSEFFIPQDIHERLRLGNRDLYNKQLSKYKDREITDKRLLELVNHIHRLGRVYEQEGYIP